MPFSVAPSKTGVANFTPRAFAAQPGLLHTAKRRQLGRDQAFVDADHPDIEQYIDWKVKEEEKVASLVTGSKIVKKAMVEMDENSREKLLQQAAVIAFDDVGIIPLYFEMEHYATRKGLKYVPQPGIPRTNAFSLYLDK